MMSNTSSSKLEADTAALTISDSLEFQCNSEECIIIMTGGVCDPMIQGLIRKKHRINDLGNSPKLRLRKSFVKSFRLALNLPSPSTIIVVDWIMGLLTLMNRIRMNRKQMFTFFGM